MMNEKFDLLSNHRNGNIGRDGDIMYKAGEHVEKSKGEGPGCHDVNREKKFIQIFVGE